MLPYNNDSTVCVDLPEETTAFTTPKYHKRFGSKETIESYLRESPKEITDLFYPPVQNEPKDALWDNTSDTIQEEKQKTGSIKDEDEMIITEMIKHDYIVQMPPKKRYTVEIEVLSIKKAEPKIVLPE